MGRCASASVEVSCLSYLLDHNDARKCSPFVIELAVSLRAFQYAMIVVLMLVGRIALLRSDGACVIGLKRLA